MATAPLIELHQLAQRESHAIQRIKNKIKEDFPEDTNLELTHKFVEYLEKTADHTDQDAEWLREELDSYFKHADYPEPVTEENLTESACDVLSQITAGEMGYEENRSYYVFLITYWVQKWIAIHNAYLQAKSNESLEYRDTTNSNIEKKYRVTYNQYGTNIQLRQQYDTLTQARIAADNVQPPYTGSEVEEYVEGIGWVLNIDTDDK